VDIRVIELPVCGRSSEIPIAIILACRLLPFRANRLANIIAAGVVVLVNGFLAFVPPLAGWGRPPAFAEYLFCATIEKCAPQSFICRSASSGTRDAQYKTRALQSNKENIQ